MVTSVLKRKTAITDAAEFDKRAERYLSRVRPYLEKQAGFQGVELVREDGGLVETTRWASMEDWRRYVRDGAAATVATMADAALPTAPYPNGTWVRETDEG
jgi:heme-degrading monooxygenase HmoA